MIGLVSSKGGGDIKADVVYFTMESGRGGSGGHSNHDLTTPFFIRSSDFNLRALPLATIVQGFWNQGVLQRENPLLRIQASFN